MIGFAEGVVSREPGVVVIRRYDGECAIGRFGSVVVAWPDCPRVQVWVLSNSRDFVLATHVCTGEPSENEVEEAEAIVRGLRFAEEAPHLADTGRPTTR